MEYIEIGQIVNTQGLKGEVKVKAFTSDNSRFDLLKKIYVEMNNVKECLKIESVRYQSDLVMLKFDSLNRIEEVEKYKGKFIYIDETDKLELEEDTYFITDLIGCNIYNVENDEKLGTLVDIFSTGSNDVYVVKREDQPDMLLPAIKQVIKHVDVKNKKIIIEVVEGLI